MVKSLSLSVLLIFSVFLGLSLLVPTSTLAQVCRGTGTQTYVRYSCASTEFGAVCVGQSTDASASCMDQAGTCWAEPLLVNATCQVQTNPTTGSQYCTFGNIPGGTTTGCYWTSGGTPTPTPSGTPAPTPGSWGECGSCSTCGYTASECVRAPDGSCIWDPGRCAYTGVSCNWDASALDSGGEECKENGEFRLEGNDICCPGDLVDIGGGCSCTTCGDNYCDTRLPWDEPNTCVTDCTCNSALTTGTPSSNCGARTITYNWYHRYGVNTYTLDLYRYDASNNRIFDRTASVTYAAGDCWDGLCSYTFTGLSAYRYLGAVAVSDPCDGSSQSVWLMPVQDLTAAAGTPDITSSSPTNNSSIALDANGRVTISWTPNAYTNYTEVDIWPSANGATCTGANSLCNINTTGTSITYTPASGVTSYRYQLTAWKNTCGNSSTVEALVNFNITSTITGYFREDPDLTASVVGTFCANGGPSNISPGSGAGISAIDRTSSTVNGTINSGAGTFSITVPPWSSAEGANNVVTLTPGADVDGVNYVCTCPAGCSYSGIESPETDLPFYLIREDELVGGWWQAIGAPAYGGAQAGTAMSGLVPADTLCNAGTSCSPFLFARSDEAVEETAGFPLTGGGGVSTTWGGETATNITNRTSQIQAQGTVFSRSIENYAYFYRKFQKVPLENVSGAPGALEEHQAYFVSGDLNIDNQWNVAAGQKLIILVDGNLNISDSTNFNNLINVETGGFLAFIASGDININANVGNETLTDKTANLEGVYIANGTINIESKGSAAGGDDAFVGEGTFVGWTGVNLARNFASDADPNRIDNHQTIPAETFIYRPDLVINAPDSIKTPRYIWQETN